jgi:3'(2'), 5'-bisphosphate nucleotidase
MAQQELSAPIPAATLVDIAIAAGAAIMPFYSPAGAEARVKVDGSPVTAADEAAEAIILERLRALGAEGIVAEEEVAAGRLPSVGDEFWLVDPLDGTKDFIGGSGEFTVNIARVAGGRPVCGVVYAPALGEVFWGDENGAFHARVDDGQAVDARPIRVAEPGARLKVVASKSHLNAETKAFIDRFPVESLVNFGSSLKLCRVADGTADLYPRLGPTCEWDIAAGHAVLAAAGGAVYAMDGGPFPYGKAAERFLNPSFVAAGPFDPFQLARPVDDA